MTLASLTHILWRQRWSVIPAVIVAGLLCLAVVATSPPTYRATGSVVLLNPPDPPQTQVGGPSIPDDWQNPYVRIGNLSVIVDLMVRVMGSDPVANDLVAAGFDGTAEIAGNRDYYSGPIVDLASEAMSQEQAIADVNLLMAAFSDQLDNLQQDTIDTYHIRAETVAVPTEATTVFSHTLRLLIVAVGFGGVLVVGTALIVERLRGRSKAKSSGGASGTDHLDSTAAGRPFEETTSGLTRTKDRNRRRPFRRRDMSREPLHMPDDPTPVGPDTHPSIDDVDEFYRAADEIIDLAPVGLGSAEQQLRGPG